MNLNIMQLSDIPSKEVDGHKGFVHRPLVNLPDKDITIRMINVVSGGKGPVPAHSHSDIHFFYVQEGHLELEVEGVAHSVPKGCCVEVPPNTVHQLRAVGDSDMTVLAIKWK